MVAKVNDFIYQDQCSNEMEVEIDLDRWLRGQAHKYSCKRDIDFSVWRKQEIY